MPICGFLLLAFASCAWSQDPRVSMMQSIYLAANTAFAVFLVERFDCNEQMKLFMLVGATAALVSVFVVLFFPEYGTRLGIFTSWQGIYIGKQPCAKNMVFLLTPGLFAPVRRTVRVFYLGSLTAIVLLARSRTGWIGLITCFAFVGALRVVSRFRRRERPFIAVLIAIFGISALVVIWQNAYTILNELGKDNTLTGRTQIWAALMQSVLKHPLLGYGYQAFWIGARGEAVNTFATTHWLFAYAHNGYLEILLQLGLAGLVAICILVVIAFRNGMALMGGVNQRYATWGITVLVVTIVYNLDEGTLFYSNELVSILFVVVCCGLSRARRNSASDERRYVFPTMRHTHARLFIPRGTSVGPGRELVTFEDLR
jgi:O-antigen ligase